MNKNIMSSNHRLWHEKVELIFPIFSKEKELFPKKIPQKDFLELVNVLKEQNLVKVVQSMVIHKIELKLRQEIVPQFWSSFDGCSNTNFESFYNAVETLYAHFIELNSTIGVLEEFRRLANLNDLIYQEEKLQDALKLLVKATLLSQLQSDYKIVVCKYYESVLKMEDSEDNSNEDCLVCLGDRNECHCQEVFHETNRKLGDMDILESLLGQTLTNLVYNYVHMHIQKICKDSFDVTFITSLENWLQDTVVNWLSKVYKYEGSNNLENFMTIFSQKLISFLYNSYTRTRIDQLFNIIIEYPESLPALEDLRTCLPRTDLKRFLIKRLQKAMETRLLHPGVSTPDVLTAYVAAIRSLRVLDPTGLLLETVTQPVHQYLRKREDTVRCVVSSLTEEGPNDLAEELIRGEAAPQDEDENWETWTPDPFDQVTSKEPTSSSNRRTSDIISMLVNVYGSKELFVNEYRTLLADRLLSQYSCDTEKEIRYLELLKLRFGDSQLHYCEVMLKDIADSKRINQNIKQDAEYKETEIPMSAMIVSAQFWPPFKEEKLQLHDKLIEQMRIFTSSFETLKGSRTLCWKNHLGIVDLEVELGDRTLNLAVSPIHATILMYFQDKTSWNLEELSVKMHCPQTILRRKISFWQSHGIIIETSQDVFVIQEVDNKNNVQEEIFLEEFESESAMASAQDQREEELQTFWSYIVGMLMNLDTLPLDRIHQMLKMFAFQGPTIECSLQELKIFLDRKVREHHLICSNGLYKLPK